MSRCYNIRRSKTYFKRKRARKKLTEKNKRKNHETEVVEEDIQNTIDNNLNQVDDNISFVSGVSEISDLLN